MRKTKNEWVTELLNEYESSLIRYSMLFTFSEESARDVVQDTFVKLCAQDRSKIEKYCKAWLYKVCRNRSLEVIRKEKRMIELTDSTLIKQQSKTKDPAAETEQRDDLELVLSLVSTLTEKQQEVVRLKFQHQLSYKEISDLVGISVSNVGFQLHDALKQLRSKMSQAMEV